MSRSFKFVTNENTSLHFLLLAWITFYLPVGDLLVIFTFCGVFYLITKTMGGSNSTRRVTIEQELEDGGKGVVKVVGYFFNPYHIVSDNCDCRCVHHVLFTTPVQQ